MPEPNRTSPASTRAAERIQKILADRYVSSPAHSHTARREFATARRDFADALGISWQTANRWLRGEHEFRLDEIERIAAWLDVPVADVWPPGPETT